MIVQRRKISWSCHVPRSLKKGPFVDLHLRQEGAARPRKERPPPDQDLVAPLDDRARHGRAHDRRSQRPPARAGAASSENMVGHKLGEFAPTRTFKAHSGDKKVVAAAA